MRQYSSFPLNQISSTLYLRTSLIGKLRHLCSYSIIVLIFLTACTSSSTSPAAAPLKVVTLDNTVKILADQTVYVPVYSHIYIKSG